MRMGADGPKLRFRRSIAVVVAVEGRDKRAEWTPAEEGDSGRLLLEVGTDDALAMRAMRLAAVWAAATAAACAAAAATGLIGATPAPAASADEACDAVEPAVEPPCAAAAAAAAATSCECECACAWCEDCTACSACRSEGRLLCLLRLALTFSGEIMPAAPAGAAAVAGEDADEAVPLAAGFVGDCRALVV